MSVRSFRSVFMVASCAGAALGCYLVSLRVASERAALESVETEIVLAQRDIRLLQTEIGTRGRLAQLERWNVKVLALSAPSADQFLDGGFALAKLVAPQEKIDLDAPVVLAAAPANAPRPRIEGTPVEDRQPDEPDSESGVSARQILHTASLKRKDDPAGPTAIPAHRLASVTAKAASEKSPVRADTPAKATAPKAKSAPAKLATAKARPVAERKAPPADPLAPIESAAKPKTLASATGHSTKESGSKQ